MSHTPTAGGWAAAPTRTGHTKAVGIGPNAGKVLYGEDAERVLNVPGWVVTSSSAHHEPERDKAATVADSRAALSRLFRGEEMTADDVREFAAGAADVPFEEMQTAARVLAHRLYRQD